ncbi:helix-turn-helix transcriptional regulator, partial [Paraburkholderia aspalathi]|nr:helix-turn-helix transcriptional regulator [Paraburkholderia aspalathi]
RHGYEIMKEIEERFGGSYVPSPGVIYPTLSWLDDMGYAEFKTEASARKCYNITAEGEAFLVANRAAADGLISRLGSRSGTREQDAEPIMNAMEKLKRTLRHHLRQGFADADTVGKIAALIEAAARDVAAIEEKEIETINNKQGVKAVWKDDDEPATDR